MRPNLKLARVHFQAINGVTPTDHIAKLTYIPSTGSIYVDLHDKFHTTVVFPSSVSLDSLWKEMRKLNGGKLLPRMLIEEKTGQGKLF